MAAALLICAVFSAAAFAEVAVTTGAGYMKMVKELSAAYKSETGHAIKEVYGGNIGQMLAQVEAGNGVNVVISDKGTLVQQKKAQVKFASMKNLGATVLVLAWRKGVDITSPADLATDKVKSVAYPDPKAAIYGRAAAAYLKTTGLGDKIGAKASQVSTVPQVFSYLASGEMDAGFVNRVVVRAGGAKIGGSMEIPSGYPAINMVAATVAGQENDADVNAFLKFLDTAKARQILKKHGVQ